MSCNARISEADLLVTLGPIEKHDTHNDGFLFRLSGSETARLTVQKATGTNTFEEVFRGTSGTFMRFFPFLVPMAGWVQHETSGWLRTEVALNDRDYSTQRSWDAFEVLEDDMGLKLTLDGSTYRKDAQNGIIAVLDDNRPPTTAEWKAFSLYWKELNFLGTGANYTGPNAIDAQIGLRVAQSPYMPLPRGFGDFVRYGMMTDQLPADDLGEALAIRLRADGTKDEMLHAAMGMANLPEEVLRQHQDLLVELARMPDKWPSVVHLLHFLYLGGPEAAPILRDLVLAGMSQDDPRLALEGLKGLCKIGPGARPIVESMGESRMTMRTRDAARYFRKRIAVSAALGIEPDKVYRVVPRRVLQDQNPGWFDKQYKKGTSRQWNFYK